MQAPNCLSDIQKTSLELLYNRKLPDDYLQFIKITNGHYFENGVVIYSTDDVFERNITFEVQIYLGDYLAIGDDSGGRSIVVPFMGQGVFIVDQGSMMHEDLQWISDSLINWIESDCLL